ncbi:hypothetical protein [Roseibium sp. M-1]
MTLPPSDDAPRTLDMEICRALYEKDPDRLLELVSGWMEANRLTLSDDFEMPAYLEAVLVRRRASFHENQASYVLVS